MPFELFAKTLVLLAFLTGCTAPQGPVIKPDLPPVPAALRACFDGVTTLPADNQWTSEVVADVVATLRVSELAKTDCGRQLLAFYDDLRTGL